MRGDSFERAEPSALERALRDRPGPEPTAAHRNRVMSGIDRALSEPISPAGRPWYAGADLVGLAAVLLVGLSLSRVASSATSFFDPPAPAPSAPAVRETAELLRRVTPGLTEDEASRITLASAYQRELLPMPAVGVGTVVPPNPPPEYRGRE